MSQIKTTLQVISSTRISCLTLSISPLSLKLPRPFLFFLHSHPHHLMWNLWLEGNRVKTKILVLLYFIDLFCLILSEQQRIRMYYNLEQERRGKLKRNEEKEKYFKRALSRPHSNCSSFVILFRKMKANLCEHRWKDKLWDCIWKKTEIWSSKDREKCWLGDTWGYRPHHLVNRGQNVVKSRSTQGHQSLHFIQAFQLLPKW